jgi:hypothetical protein
MLALAASSPDATIMDLCAKAGISHTAHYNWCRSDPGYAETFSALRESRLDTIESNVLAELARRSTPEMLTAFNMQWLLALAGYLAKARRRVVDVNVSGQVDHAHRYDTMSFEEAQAELDRRLRLRQHRQAALRN